MFKKICLTLLISGYLFEASNASIASYNKVCKAHDRDCRLASNLQIAFPYIADGIPELGMPPAEPMKFENVTLQHEDFKLVLLNMDVISLKKCKFLDFNQNEVESTFKFTLDCPLKASGKYRFLGKIFIFDVDNEGDFTIQTDSVKTTFDIKAEETQGTDGKKYWNLLGYNYSFDLEKIHIGLDNLFSGDIEPNNPFFTFFNKNWSSSSIEIGKPIADISTQYFFEVLQTFFLRVPIDQLVY
ncbi:uncharacterized protein [Battus philenor]|uniref:uncharacterized protein n=1 Tax=Battus philenor TaxID=42288 RepID=UPI0035CFCA62